VSVTNSCDRMGTIASELPITEQIPVSLTMRKKNIFLEENTCGAHTYEKTVHLSEMNE
jgi:hypothetical protein